MPKILPSIMAGSFYKTNPLRPFKTGVFTKIPLHVGFLVDANAIAIRKVEQLARANFHRARRGYRKGVLLVPVGKKDLSLFESRTVKLTNNQNLWGKFERRRRGEEPRISWHASVDARGRRPKALRVRSVDIVLYHKTVLAENSERSTNADYEIITVLVKPGITDEPMHPWTLMYNHFGFSGGTRTKMNPKKFESELRRSMLYWKNHALS
jgi:hypothetical protein